MSLGTFAVLFLLVDFFDRIDNILPEKASAWLVIQYFIFKLPTIISLMLPVAMLVSVLLTFGVLSKNSEITAMRASGVTVFYLAKPALVFGFILSIACLLWNETVVPYSFRRTKEIYNIDIKRKDQLGSYSQTNFWWRSGGQFFSVDVFDSRSNMLLNLIKLQLDNSFNIKIRTDAAKASYVGKDLAWTMHGVNQYNFKETQQITDKTPKTIVDVQRIDTLPLVISEVPKDFYDTQPEEESMSYLQLRRYIKKQLSNGLDAQTLLARLYSKLAAPLLTFLVIPVVLPFALKTARSGSLAMSFVAAFIIAFVYFAFHSFGIALGTAMILPPMLAAWMANIIMAFAGLILCLGAESPT